MSEKLKSAGLLLGSALARAGLAAASIGAQAHRGRSHRAIELHPAIANYLGKSPTNYARKKQV